MCQRSSVTSGLTFLCWCFSGSYMEAGHAVTRLLLHSMPLKTTHLFVCSILSERTKERPLTLRSHAARFCSQLLSSLR